MSPKSPIEKSVRMCSSLPQSNQPCGRPVVGCNLYFIADDIFRSVEGAILLPEKPEEALSKGTPMNTTSESFASSPTTGVWKKLGQRLSSKSESISESVLVYVVISSLSVADRGSPCLTKYPEHFLGRLRYTIALSWKWQGSYRNNAVDGDPEAYGRYAT